MNDTEYILETREQYHKRCEERRKQAAERARKQRQKMAVFGGGVALIFIALIGMIAGIHMVSGHAQAARLEAQEQARAEALATLEEEEVPLDADAVIEAAQIHGQSMTAAYASQIQLSAGTALPDACEPLQVNRPSTVRAVPEDVVSERALLLNLGTGEIVAERGSMYDRIYPASMTKVLTLLVAAENLPETWEQDTFTMLIEITDFSFVNDCSNVGFEVGEQVPVKDLFYGTILPSGADAAVGLAYYIAGSQEAFVELMNAKLDALGLSDSSHFTNCVGLYHDDHYTTCHDMAVIMKAAMDNPFCREVLSTHIYTTAQTEQHPEGIILSNWFLRRIEDKDCGGTVVGAKTGFVVQSKNCAVSFAQDTEGTEYICVTAGSSSSWRAIYDQVSIYHDNIS